MRYWSGTNIKKSNANAFDWKGSGSQLSKDPEMKRLQIAKQQTIIMEPRYTGLLLIQGGKTNG